jgi:hypothetical protein
LPNAIFAGLAASVPAVTPVPVSGTFRLEFDALLTSAMLPLAAAADVGVKVAVKVVLCPGFSVAGVVRPRRLKPLPLAEACEIVTLAPPLFVNVMFCI